VFGWSDCLLVSEIVCGVCLVVVLGFSCWWMYWFMGFGWGVCLITFVFYLHLLVVGCYGVK